MKILYGVQGTGNGHISRARALNKFLKKNNIEVDYLFSGRPREKYFDMEEFGDWRCCRGLSFVHDAGRLKVLQTLHDAGVRELLRDIRTLDMDGYDLVVTDFEPITAWAARKAGKTSLGIGHQYAFRHSVPLRGDNFIGRKIMEYFAPAEQSLGLHWHHFGQPILPPIVDIDHGEMDVDSHKILVYLGFEDIDQVIAMLEPFDDYSFYFYGPFDHPESLGHIKLRPLSREGFKRDLLTANGVICNAGFELSSEAIQLGKKLLVKPLMGQMEQLSNARAMEQLQLAMTMDTLDKGVTSEWLAGFSAKRVVYPNVAEAIALWIADKGWERPESKQELISSLWGAISCTGVDGFDFGQDVAAEEFLPAV